MKIQLIRNATLVIRYGGKSILVDPFLAEQGAYPGIPNTANYEKRNPLVGLPIPNANIIKVDAVIVTHLHSDHFDHAAVDLLPKDMPIFAQSPDDAKAIRKSGFLNVQTFEAPAKLGDISFFKTGGQHGTGEIGKLMGPVSGIVMQHSDEQTLYIAGDTIWCNEVEETIGKYQPQVIVVNGGAAQPLGADPITMTKEDIHQVHMAARDSTIIVCHMEAVNHCLLTREELRSYVSDQGLASKVRVPEDGETIAL
ncbi:MBL fold metallo-hydrolase [Paenibacillus sp. GCM10012307]|uniref:MBL fold metallo-hydrolase n=1 Tax=Paenibacillus roseus TaxID=2798579 RepID=A0A934MLP1_9BACL|nr:MBL fold metallo-hydrolase [Paenibacillus roseus]MBJ6362410.1 MBL fold metallo-hydrolase [Paenibacillus roseus]